MSALRAWLRAQRACEYAERMERGACLECGVPLILGDIDGVVVVAPFHPHWGRCPSCRFARVTAEYERAMTPLLTVVWRVLWPETDGAL